MENAIRQLLEEAGKILADRKQETQLGKCFNCVDICGVGTIETRHTEIIEQVEGYEKIYLVLFTHPLEA